MVIDVASPSHSNSPRNCRSRSPCPHSFSDSPTGRAAPLQWGHRSGRSLSTDGILSIHSLTSTPEMTTLVLLDGIDTNEHDGNARSLDRLGRSRHLFLEADDASMLASLPPAYHRIGCPASFTPARDTGAYSMPFPSDILPEILRQPIR